MKAVVLYEHGGPDKLRYKEHFPDPDVALERSSCASRRRP